MMASICEFKIYRECMRPNCFNQPLQRDTWHGVVYYFFTASQMWLLACILPAIVGRFVAEDDEKWSNLILLLRITGYLFAPRLTSDEADYLALLIEQHHQTFCDLYPDKSVIPKFHYMVHMLRLIKK